MTKSTSLFIATTAVLVFALAPLADARPDHRGRDGDSDGTSKKEHASKDARQGRGSGNGETRRVRRDERSSDRGVDRGRQARRDDGRSERVIDRTPRDRGTWSGDRTRRDRGTWSGDRTRDQRGDSRYRTAPAPRDGDGTRYRSRSWHTEHRTWYQRGGYRGYRIPHSWFSIHFGRRHPRLFSSFEIRIVDARPQFECDGYWFTLLDQVPEYWAYDWYETDEISIVELEDGYYMVNEEDPDVLLAIDVVAG